ncbi:MAG: phage major capsid protein, partial [Bacillota bacterium]
MSVKNLDLLKQQKDQWTSKIQEAVKSGDEAAFASAFVEYTNALQEAVIAEARGLVQATDTQILAGRGVRVLTSEEHTYYQKLIEAMRSDNPKQALSGFDAV